MMPDLPFKYFIKICSMERSDHIPDQLDPVQYDFQAEIDCTKTDLLISILQQIECKGDMFSRNYCVL